MNHSNDSSSSGQTGQSSQSMPDVQNYKDGRNVAINRVGIKRIRVPVIISDHESPQSTVAECALSVYLPEDQKGTHMSRFSQLLYDYRNQEITTANINEIHNDMLSRLNSKAGTLSVSFTYFIEKTAPVSGLPGMMDYQVTLTTNTNSALEVETRVRIDLPVTTLCPCSKEISNYGAHSQRSIISIDALVSNTSEFSWRNTVETAEAKASAQLYSQLKRADEKFVTEHAYDNPRFVEDLIREVATVLNEDPHISSYILDVENFESIHNHSAFAEIITE